MALQDLISKVRKTKLYKAINNVVRDSGQSINNQAQQRIGQPVRQWANRAYNESKPRTNLEFASAPFMKMTGSQALQNRQDLIDQRNRGLNLTQRLFRTPQQDENKLLQEGIYKGAKTVGTVGIPAYKGLAVANAGLGYGISRLAGANNRQALGSAVEAAQIAPIIGAFSEATNPVISRQLDRLPVQTPQFIQNRIAPTIANIGQGIGIDVATGNKTNALSVGLDALTGFAGGKGQFSTVKPRAKGVEATDLAKNQVRSDTARSLPQSPAQSVNNQVQAQGVNTKRGIEVKPSRTVNTQGGGFRTSGASEGSITGNPVKDDITGANPTGIISRIREVVQDNWIRVKNLQRQEGVKVSDEANPYQAEELYHGRVATRIEDVKQQVVNYDNDVLNTSKKLNLPDKSVKKLVNIYLQAKHAPERNKVHGDGAAGMTNAQSAKILSNISNSKAGKEIIRLSKQVQDLNNQTIDVLYKSQVIDKKMYDTLRKTYKNHVPLNRVMNESDDITEVLVGKGFNVKSSGVKRAKGSDRQVSDILTNVVTNLESAIVRAEKNIVNLATLNFARNNPQLGIFEVIKPKAIGQTFDGKILTQQINDPLVLTVRENGKPVYLRIKDKKLASVFQGIGNEKLPGAFKFVQMFTGFYSGLHTRFNPEFAVSNVVRDVQEMSVFMASQKDVGFSGAAETLGKEGSSVKHILDYMRGVDSEGAKLYRQMKLDGGTTGGMALSTRKNVELDLKKIEQLNRSNPRKAAQKTLELFDQWNTIFEDATRLSVYRQALDNGMSRKQAASLAKNSTVNFNKKGTGGAIINALYMFSNASIQGSVKMLRAMKNPKVAAATITAVGTATFAVNNWNDQVDPDWREKVTDWDRNSNLVLMLPSKEGSKYITIPVSWGLKPIKVGSDVSYDLITGNENDVVDASIKIASSAFDAYNPAGGQDMISALTPTILDAPVDISRNQSWSGASIKPDWLEGLPASEQKFKNTGETLSGKVAIGVADTLSKASIEISPENILYAYEQYIGGVGKFATRVAGTTTSLISGEAPEAKEVPFTNRFYKARSEEQVQSAVAYKKQDDFFESLKDFQTGSQEQKEAIKNYLRQQASDKERQSTLFKLRDRGIDTKGISYSGKKLGVSNTPPQSDKVSFVDYEDQPSNILDKITLAANGMTKDPGNTIKAIFTQEELRKIEGNAVILKRQEFLNKASDPNLERDHIIPLGLGGDNSEANLVYVSKEYHAEKTKLDQKLIRQLRSGEITRQEAQDQVRAWVEANPTEHFVVETDQIIGDKAEDKREVRGVINKEFEIEKIGEDGTSTTTTISITVPEYPKLTGLAEVDKKLKSSYYSKLTTAKNNAEKLYNARKITAQEFEDVLVELGTKQKTAKAYSSGGGTNSKYHKALLNIIKSQNRAQMAAFEKMSNAKIRAYSPSSGRRSGTVQPINTKNLTFSGAGY